MTTIVKPPRCDVNNVIMEIIENEVQRIKKWDAETKSGSDYQGFLTLEVIEVLDALKSASCNTSDKDAFLKTLYLTRKNVAKSFFNGSLVKVLDRIERSFDEALDGRIGFFIREDKYGFLSNFERTPFEVDGKVYQTNEHYFQSQVTDDAALSEYIRQAPHARVAMVLGREIVSNKYLRDKYLRRDWGEETQKKIMLKGTRAKYRNPILRTSLLDTGYMILFENNPEDAFWGIGDGSGLNWLGKIIMSVRDEIRLEAEK